MHDYLQVGQPVLRVVQDGMLLDGVTIAQSAIHSCQHVDRSSDDTYL